MLTANLLPPEGKKLIKLEECIRMVRFFGIGIAALLVVGLILLIPSYMFLSRDKRNLEKESAAVAALAQKLRLEEMRSSAIHAHGLLTEVRTFLDRPSRASELISALFVEADGVRVETLSITAGGDVILNGFAETRDDLLDFHTELQDSKMFDVITFPISDIIHSADIQFTMNGKLKAEKKLY